jgi:hypothetical protein
MAKELQHTDDFIFCAALLTFASCLRKNYKPVILLTITKEAPCHILVIY